MTIILPSLWPLKIVLMFWGTLYMIYTECKKYSNFYRKNILQGCKWKRFNDLSINYLLNVLKSTKADRFTNDFITFLYTF